MGVTRMAEGETAAAAGRALPRDGLLLLVAITLFWGLNWPVMKLAVAEVPVWTFRTICLAVGGAGLLMIGRLSGQSLRIPRRELRPLLLTAFFNITGWHLCSAFGLLYMSAGRASILALTMPLWATLLAVPILGERLTRTTVVGLALGLAGLGALILPDWRLIAAQPIGVMFMLGAAVFWAAGTVSFKYFRWTIPLSALTGWQLLLGGVPVAVGALFFDAGFTPATVSRTGWLATLYAAFLPMLFCQWAWFRVVARFPAAIAAIGIVAIPAVGVFSGALFLGEPVGFDVLISLALVSGALAVVLVGPIFRRAGTIRNGA
jgi:drug/metabolite transporter (DMT)-like permease